MPTFQASVWDRRAGKPIKRTFPTRSAARSWRADAQAQLRAGDLVAARGQRLDAALDEWLELLEAGHERTRSGEPYRPATIRSYERCLRRFGVREALGAIPVDQVRPRDVQRWLDGLVKQRIASATVSTALTPLRAFYRRAVARGEAPSNPVIGVMAPAVRTERRQVATPAQAAAMVAALDGDDRRLWATAFYAGLRRGELIGLRREDVDLAAGVIHVRRGWDMRRGEVPPKSRAGRRRVPIPAALRDELDALPLGDYDGGRERTNRQSRSTVFTSALFPGASWVAKAHLRAARWWAEVGLPPLTLHEARHTHASLMIAAGVNAKALSSFMGHSNIGVTLDLYGHLFPGSEDAAAGLFDAFLAREVGSETVRPSRITVAHPANR